MRTKSARLGVAGDVTLAAAVAVSGCIAGHQYHPAPWLEFDVWAYALTLVSAAALLVHRRAPVTVLVVTCLAYTAYLTLGYHPSLNYWIPVIALVSLAGRRPPRTSVPGALLTAAVIVHSGISGRLPASLIAVQAVIVPVIALAFGETLRRLGARNAELRRLTLLLARRQEEEAERAIVDERVRIARELHDVVAHHISVISVQAGLASYVFTSDPATAHGAVEAVAGASREALDELRRLLVVLRVDPAKDRDASMLTPLPGVDRIPELAQRVELAGVQVEIRTSGTPRPLAPGLELCAYRVVQEALTNVVKHARASRAEVHIQYRPRSLGITVLDDGSGGGGGSSDRGGPRTGSGLGLLGMRERVRIWDGMLTTGVRAEGGYEVRLTLPVEPPG